MRFRNPIAEIAAYHMCPSQGGHHLCYIRLQYTDEKGIVNPCERGILDVRVTGGKLVGLGSACPYYELDYRGSRADTYYGEALAIVEAGKEGTVTLEASDGKRTAQAIAAVEG